MKMRLYWVLTVLLCVTLLAGCPWFKPNPPDDEGEGEVPIEGEPVTEGEPGEGEPLIEGEPVTELFTSADSNSYYRNDMDTITDEPAMEDETEGDERELVEPDVIRRAGDLLYILNQYRGLTIANLESESLLSQTPTYGYPRDLYLVDDYAYVLVSYAHEITVVDDLLSVTYGSKIYVLNVADPGNVVVEGAFNFTGDLVDSRMVGDIIYAVCSDYTYYDAPREGDDVIAMEAAEKTYGATWAVSVNIADSSNIAIADSVAFPGYGNLIQATNYAIFSVSADWDYETNSYLSIINYIDITDPQGALVMRGTAYAPGYMADRFKLDAWNGALRVVTNTWWPDRQTYITAFDITQPDDIVQLGQTTLESASGESLFATRFDGPLAYIVTYMMVDPLFVVDLSDPAKPEVKGELKIPGWSTHIEPRGDRLIALGVDDTDGRKVMVSLFDVSNPAAPSRIAYESFGENWAWSAAYNDVKAFTVLDDIILIPFSGWNYGSGGYDRLQFVSYTQDSLEAQGYVDLQGSAIRSFRSSNHYYAVTQEQLAVIDASDLANPAVVNSVTLAENVVDVAPLSGDWLVEVIARYDVGDTLLRVSHPDPNTTGGSIALPVSYVSNTFVWNDTVVAVATMYEYEPEYRSYYLVFQVNFSQPETPVISGRWQIDLQPWYGGWWYRGPMDVMVEKDAMYYWGGYGGDAVYFAGDYLALRGTAERYDIIFGDVEPWQGLALVDLASPEDVVYAGLGFEDVVAVNAAEGNVLITTKRQVGQDGQQRNICAYFLRSLNPATLEMTRSVNVPGVFLHRLPGTQLLLFEDQQYADDWQTITIVRSTEIVGSTVRLLDSAKLPVGYWTLKADGTNVFYSGYNYGDYYYNNEYILGFHTISRSGTFMQSQEIIVSRSWINLLGAKGNNAYIAVGNAAVVQYDFNNAPPAVAALVPVMGYPQKIRYSENTAYVPLGYSGIITIPR